MGTGQHYYYIASEAEDVKDPGMIYGAKALGTTWAVLANQEMYLRINLKGSTFSYTPWTTEATPFKTRDQAEKMAFDIVSLNPDMIHKLRVKLV